ncbi:hypothetical protein Cni_G11875 [Canna indica]|uniref:RING-type E3 ubiquitin transferase n=1 Tax=Canna indica TaxID=4628 RepID=A0AAQ3K8R8_9LILI|nr:hypothetical protein Cni_G11875 [Canna indica]
MGAVCSCLLAEDTAEYPHSDASVLRSCTCLRCLAQQLITAYIAIFQRGEVRSVTSSIQGRVPFAIDDTVPDTYQSPPRPIPYDDPRFSRPQHDGLISRHDKIISHFQGEPEPWRSNYSEAEALRMEGTCKSNSYGGSKVCGPESSLKNSAETRKEITYIFPSSEDEDGCPTCLEEYTSEDPKIIMQCSHHFHLGCIYEWMERSEACPVCGKMMVFKEAT